MKAYIGCKIILAEPSTRAEGEEPGYTVFYADDGYKSWSPAEVFEEAYRPVSAGEISIVQGTLGSAAPDTFKSRLGKEIRDLSEKLDKLSAFMDLSPVFDTLDPDDQKLMTSQRATMSIYLEILQHRAARIDQPELFEIVGQVKITGGDKSEEAIPFK